MTLGCNAATKSTMHFSDISNLVSNNIEGGTIKAQPTFPHVEVSGILLNYMHACHASACLHVGATLPVPFS